MWVQIPLLPAVSRERPAEREKTKVNIFLCQGHCYRQAGPTTTCFSVLRWQGGSRILTPGWRLAFRLSSTQSLWWATMCLECFLSREHDQGMAPSPPSLMWEQVNTNHAGGGPDQIWPASSPAAGQWTCLRGKSTLASFERWLRCTELGLCSLQADYDLLLGDHTAKLLTVVLPEPLLSHPLSSWPANI